MIKVLNDRNVLATIEFPSHLMEVEASLKELKITKDDFLNNHTLYPLYHPFLFESEQKDITKMMYGHGGMGIKGKIGFLAGSILKKDFLYYCPVCTKQDFEKYGESYFRAYHQMQGVFNCHKHNIYLKKYPIFRKEISRLRYLHIDEKLVDISNNKKCLNNINIRISKMIYQIQSGKLRQLHAEKLKGIYKSKLDERGLITVNGCVRFRKLYKDFFKFYSNDFLSNYESNIDEDTEFNWLKILLRGKKRKVHPVRHLLFIIFLFGDLKALIKYSRKENKDILYPCLNLVSNHYKKLVIKNVIVTADYETRELVGNFECQLCGFKYSRKMKDDIYHIGRIKEFGHVWFDNLRLICNRDDLSLRAKARKMKCDPKTIKKNCNKIKKRNK